ncbi:hypothetical protein LR021_02650 [Candidatus Bipolaricaulota bacterium]|nr:hypothetical protein [Candidatus Bipolaricaulota bacterium]
MSKEIIADDRQGIQSGNQGHNTYFFSFLRPVLFFFRFIYKITLMAAILIMGVVVTTSVVSAAYPATKVATTNLHNVVITLK